MLCFQLGHHCADANIHVGCTRLYRIDAPSYGTMISITPSSGRLQSPRSGFTLSRHCGECLSLFVVWSRHGRAQNRYMSDLPLPALTLVHAAVAEAVHRRHRQAGGAASKFAVPTLRV